MDGLLGEKRFISIMNPLWGALPPGLLMLGDVLINPF